MHSSTSSFDRVIPALPWRGMLTATVVIVVAACVVWEGRARALGYRPTLNETTDLWAQQREKVKPDSLVVIGDSRAWYDIDLDEMEKGFGKRPIQLAIPGSCAFPLLEEFANDPAFHGTIVCSLLPGIWLVPPDAPPYQRTMAAINRYRHWNIAQRAGHQLGMFLEDHVAFLREEDLTLEQLLISLNIPDRPDALVPPRLPPYFQTVDRERRARMFDLCEKPGLLQDTVRSRWMGLFVLPKPPPYVPPAAFQEGFQKFVEGRFRATAALVTKLHEHGGKIVFVRFPMSGLLRARENEITPRAQVWDPLVQMSGAPSVHFLDYPELASFTCPEYSHLSAADSVEFTRRLVPHLKSALGL